MTPRRWGLLSVLAVLWGGAFFAMQLGSARIGCGADGSGAVRHLGASTLGALAIVGAAISYAFAGAYGRRFRAMPAAVPVAGMLTTPCSWARCSSTSRWWAPRSWAWR